MCVCIYYCCKLSNCGVHYLKLKLKGQDVVDLDETRAMVFINDASVYRFDLYYLSTII